MAVSEAGAASRRSQCSCSVHGCRQLDATIPISRWLSPGLGTCPRAREPT